MNGYVFDAETRIIATKIVNVTKCNDATIKGESLAVLGTGEYVITDMDFSEGDLLPIDIVDNRTIITLLIVQ
jgi:hypothetical protein